MKTTGKRGASGSVGAGTLTGVLDAPEDEYVREDELTETAASGSLRRRRAAGYGETGYAETEDYAGSVRRRGLNGRRRGVRGRGGWLPRTTWGRVLVGGGVFAGVVGLAAAGLGLRSYLLHDARFVVATSEDIQIEGNRHLAREQLLSVFGADLERNIFKIPLAERRADLERLPWVGHATVMRLLPNQIRVEIQERTPVAFAKQGTQIGLVDANGVLLDMPVTTEPQEHYSFPVLTGIDAGDPQSTRKARMEIYREFMAALDGSAKDGGAKDGVKPTDSLSEVDVSDPEDVKAVVASQGMDVLVHFGEEKYLTRYQEFEDHLADWKQQYPKLVSADMRYENQIVLDTGTALPGGAAADGSAGGGGAVSAPAAAVSAPVAAKPAAGVPLEVKAPAAAKAPSVKAAAVKPAAVKKVAALKKPVVKAKLSPKQKLIAKETNASNQRMYAALAAAHKAELAKAAAAKGSGSVAVQGGASR